MAIQKIPNGMTGANASQLLFDNDKENEASAAIKDLPVWSNIAWTAGKQVIHEGVYYRAAVNVAANQNAPNNNPNWAVIGNSIRKWSATAWRNGDQVLYNGVLYEANANTLATEIPGTSTKWVVFGGDFSSVVLKSDVDTNFAGGAGKVASADNVRSLKQRTDGLLYSRAITTWVVGIRLNNQGQEVTGQSAFRTLPLTPIVSGRSYRFLRLTGSGSASTTVVAFYTQQGAFISESSIVMPPNSSANTLDDSGIILPPQNATHFRASGASSGNPEVLEYYPLIIGFDNTFAGGNDTTVIPANRSLQIKDRVDQAATEYRFIPLYITEGDRFILEDGSVVGLSGTGPKTTEPILINPGDSFRFKDLQAVNTQQGISNLVAFYTAADVYIRDGSIVVPPTTYIADTGIVYPPPNASYVRFYSMRRSVTGPNRDGEIYIVRPSITKQRIEATEPSYNIPYVHLRSGYINDTSGVMVISENTSFSVTDFVEVEPWSRYRLRNAQGIGQIPVAGVFFYDANKQGIRGYGTVLGPDEVLSDSGIQYAPREARYARMSGNRAATPTLDIYNARGAVKSVQNQINDKSKPFVFMGDSIAQGIANAIREPMRARGHNFIQRTVGGEGTLDTAARWGSIPLVAPKGITIPAGRTPVSVLGYTSLKGWKVTFDAQGNVTSEGGSERGSLFGTMGAIIGGIRGIITFTREPNLSANFVRDEPGQAYTLQRPEIMFAAPSAKDVNLAVMMGTNGGWFVNDPPVGSATNADMENLVTYFKQMRDMLTPHNGNFCFLGFYETSSVLNNAPYQSLMEYFEGRMFEEFGGNYFNIRRYLMTSVKQDLNLTWTSGDIDAIVNRGRIPISVRGGSNPNLSQVHLSTAASRAVANQVLKFWSAKGIMDYFQVDPFSPDPDPDA